MEKSREAGCGRLLDGETALVTGGGTNIGKGIARRMLEEGAVVTIASRNLEVLNAASEELAREIEGAEIRVAACDITKAKDVESAIEVATSGTGRLDIAIANAGGGTPKLFLDIDESQWREELDVNLIGTANTFRAAALAMKESGGVLIATSSHLAINPGLGVVPYNCAKAGVDALVQGLALELAHLNIRVNAVRPGTVLPPASENAAPMSARFKAAWEVFEADLLDAVLVGRLGTPADIADTVLHLVGPAGSWITGQSITVDGGASLHHGDDMRGLALAMDYDDAGGADGEARAG